MTAQDQQSRADLSDFDAWYAKQCMRSDDAKQGLIRAWALLAWKAARALPAGMEPVGWVDKRSIDWLADLGRGPNSYTQTQIHKTREGVEDGQAIFTAAQVLAMGRVPPATKVSRAHEFRPNKKYPWFCADCGYAPHDELMHTAAPRPPAAQDDSK